MLKSIVIGLGVLIVVAMAGMAYAIYYKATNPDFTLFKSDSGAAPAREGFQAGNQKPLQPFADFAIELPEGCRIAEMIPARGRRLLLKVGPPGSCERIIVLDVHKGLVLGTITVKSGPVKSGP
ncbi:MAG: hypothetical protein V3R66_08395 [Rhodospirillales bacterium]